MELKEKIALACAQGASYHLPKKIVEGIREGKRFRYWQGVLSLDIPEQKEFYDTISENPLISNYAVILHNSDCTEDGEKVRDHVHFFIQSSNDLTYLNMCKKTGFDCVVIIPTTKDNMDNWHEYVTDHDGKHTYDDTEVKYSTEDFRRKFEGEPSHMRDMGCKERIDTIKNAMNDLFSIFSDAYLKQADAYDYLSADPVTAEVFNFPVLVRCFVDVPVHEHNEHISKVKHLSEKDVYNCDTLIRCIREGKLPKEVDDMLLNYYHTGRLAPLEYISEDDMYLNFVEDDPPYEDIDKFWADYVNLNLTSLKEN